MITVELTNYCNLSCVYCNSRLGLREFGFIKDDTFYRVAEGIRQLGISRVRVVGGGEPTLHPKFAEFMYKLAEVAPYLSVLSNGQWRQPSQIVEVLLEAPVNLIEVSVEGKDKNRYENSSRRGDFQRLLDNLSLLKHEKERTESKALVNLRVMVRPSDSGKEKVLKAFWKKYGDTVMLQRLIEMKGLEHLEDLYKPTQFVDKSYPVCTLPFKEIGVNWNGDVPLCFNSVAQYGPPGFMLGNVNNDGLPGIWNSDVLRQYRKAHHKRIHELMPICKGCSGV